jgi:1-acyl-sn-glycerol-3-phosphate acyltransferase
MPNPLQWLRSLAFIIQMYVMMFLMAIFFTPLAIWKRDWAFRAIHTYCNWVRWTAGWMVGLKSEIRGEVPADEVLIASKHQSFFDIIMIVSVVPRPKFIMKQQLQWAPIVGYYAKRIGCIAVDRGKRSLAIKQMVADVKSGKSMPGQLIIFPQGTRVAAGATSSYKIGTGVLYRETGEDCVPAATNVGVFWKRHGIMRYPGLAVVEFLPRIRSGMEIDPFMKVLESAIESGSNRLMAEAGFRMEAGHDAD